MGASYTVNVSFTVAPSCQTTTIGHCTYNPCAIGASTPGAGATAMNAGAITVVIDNGAPLTIAPESDGTYAALSGEGQPAWTAGGEPIAFQWSNAPGETSPPGGSASLTTPPYVALSPQSAFATNPGTVSRARDIVFLWTSDSTPSDLDQLVIDVTTKPSQLLCEFAVSAGTGTIPAAALSLVSAGPATYDVHAKEYASDSVIDTQGTRWNFGFNIDAHARGADALARGSITLD